MKSSCTCSLVPEHVLEKLSADTSLPPRVRLACTETVKADRGFRKVRTAQKDATFAGTVTLAVTPTILVYDERHSQTLPGAPIPSPTVSDDATAKRCALETAAVASFYQAVFGRNSVDDHGATLASSIHYGNSYNNAMWNGHQMIYGAGDGQIFLDFTASNDVIGHELTHGVTQHTAGLIYSGESGALNESISDCFGSMFRQWQANQTSATADWLIGASIMGPAAVAKGYTCLRDMASPGATHCLSPQPGDYAHYVPGGDVHTNSGIPNRAFCLAAKACGGNSWTKVGKVWYGALTSPKATPGMGFKKFAALTVAIAKSLYPMDGTVQAAVVSAWNTTRVLP